MFWGDELTSLLAEQTNVYSVQKSGTSIGTTRDEIEQLLAMQMYMSIVRLPSYQMFWAGETRFPPLRHFLHVSDSTLADVGKNKGNRLYKIQPVFDHVQENCLKIQSEVENSIDEQIILAKTKYSSIWQYSPRKPVKWGFKNFVRAGMSGMIYDFFLYTLVLFQPHRNAHVNMLFSAFAKPYQEIKITNCFSIIGSLHCTCASS